MAKPLRQRTARILSDEGFTQLMVEGTTSDAFKSALVAGTHVHGLIDQAEALSAILAWAGVPDAVAEHIGVRREADLNRLSDAVERHLDLERLLREAQAFDRRAQRS